MNTLITATAAVLLLTLQIPIPALSQAASLQRCQALQDRIEQYTRLRRGGGSAHQMEAWKKQLRSSEEQFEQYACRQYRRLNDFRNRPG